MIALLTALVVFVVFMVAAPSRDFPDHRTWLALAAFVVALIAGLAIQMT